MYVKLEMGDDMKLRVRSLKNEWYDLIAEVDGSCHTIHFECVMNNPISELLISPFLLKDSRDIKIEFFNLSECRILYIDAIGKGLCAVRFEENIEHLSQREFTRAILRLIDRFLYESELDNPSLKSSAEKLRNLYSTL